MLGIDAAEVSSHRAPWNKGRLIGQKRPLKPKEVWAIRVRLQLEERRRDLALFNLALDSKLRGCDLVRLQVNDVCVGGRVRDRATVIQRKTGRPVQFEITEQTRAAIRDWVANSVPRNGQYLFPSRFHDQPHISTRQYARIVHHWVERAGLDSSAYGTHSMRRTKAAQIYKKTGNLRAVQLLLETTTNCPRTPDRGADLLFVPPPVRRDRTDSQAIRLSRRRARRHSAAGRVERLHTGVDDARGSGALQAVC
jgi:integrase